MRSLAGDAQAHRHHWSAIAVLTLATVACTSAPVETYKPTPLPPLRVTQIWTPSSTTGQWTFCGDACAGPSPKTLPTPPVPVIPATPFALPPRTPSVPTPPPVPKAPTAPLATLRLSADTTFGFASAALSDVGRHSLDVLGDQLKDPTLTLDVSVTGYTDRIGGLAYNQRLSERRAEAVAAYLHRYVSHTTIRTEGRGPTGSLTAQSCQPSLPNAQLIQCLAPDRRVEITVVSVTPS